MELHEQLKKLRLKSGLTQEQVAEKVYVTHHAVSQWERGVREPDFSMLEKLGELYGAKLIFDENKKLMRLPSVPNWFPNEDWTTEKNAKRIPKEWHYSKDYQWAYSEMEQGEKIDILFLYQEEYYSQHSFLKKEHYIEPILKVLDWHHTRIIAIETSLEKAVITYHKKKPHLVFISGEINFAHQSLKRFYQEDNRVQLIPIMGLETVFNSDAYKKLVIELISKYYIQRFIDFTTSERDVARILTETYVKARNDGMYERKHMVDAERDDNIIFYHVFDDEMRKEVQKACNFIFEEYERSEREHRPFMPHLMKNKP